MINNHYYVGFETFNLPHNIIMIDQNYFQLSRCIYVLQKLQAIWQKVEFIRTVDRIGKVERNELTLDNSGE